MGDVYGDCQCRSLWAIVAEILLFAHLLFDMMHFQPTNNHPIFI